MECCRPGLSRSMGDVSFASPLGVGSIASTDEAAITQISDDQRICGGLGSWINRGKCEDYRGPVEASRARKARIPSRDAHLELQYNALNGLPSSTK